MPLFRRKGGETRGGPDLRATGGEVLDVVVAYLKQETLEPIKGAGRFILFGLAGSVLLGTGILLLLVGLLRFLQTETGTTFSGNLSWVPYLIVAAVAAVVTALFIRRIAKGPATRRRPVTGEEK